MLYAGVQDSKLCLSTTDWSNDRCHVIRRESEKPCKIGVYVTLGVMQKLSFALDVEDGWPPVAIEHVWCEKSGEVYELVNAPFFIHGLAFGDRFTAEPDAINGCIFEFTVVESSGHSLVWLLEREGLQLDDFKPKLLELGCRIEGLPAFKLHAIDVPASVEPMAVSEAVDRLEGLGFALAFPVWRHEQNGA